MKRFFFGVLTTLVVCLSAFTLRAGGGHGCGGGHGGGYYGGHGGGYYGGHGHYGGYYGGHGYYGGGCWPSFSFGIGFGGCYPTYSYYYGYPAYGYAYAPAVYAQPTYVYRAVQPYTPSVSPTARPAATKPVYVYSRPASAPVVQKAHNPAPAKPTVAPAAAPASAVAASKPSTGKWVLDPNPYRYTPAISGSSGAAGTYVVTR
jgi:hypothetical protein